MQCLSPELVIEWLNKDSNRCFEALSNRCAYLARPRHYMFLSLGAAVAVLPQSLKSHATRRHPSTEVESQYHGCVPRRPVKRNANRSAREAPS